MGNCCNKPTMRGIVDVYNEGVCYLTDPPSYSPTYVTFEDGTRKSYPDRIIIDELHRQGLDDLWKYRHVDADTKSMLRFMASITLTQS